MFSLRFDLRLSSDTSARAHYAAALDMVEWAEPRGGSVVVLSEHHGVADGYLPAPGAMAAAVAARTTSTFVMVAAALLPLHDPVRLAEEIAVVDHVSGGRVAWVLGLGYRPEEYAMFGVDWQRRGAIADEKLDVLLSALDGKTFDYGGRRGQVTPVPELRPGLYWGGRSHAAARRAARFGLGFFAQTDVDGIGDTYRDECRRLGREAGPCMTPSPDDAVTVFVAADVEKAWLEIGPYLLRDAMTYAAWNHEAPPTTSVSFAPTVDDLRAEGRSHRILTVDDAVAMSRQRGGLWLHPLCGGLPPDLAWPYLEAVGERVEPAVTA